MIMVENNNDKDMKLSAPWMIYFNQIKAMFSEDIAVKAVWDGATYTIKLYVDGEEKAEALSQLLPQTKQFGNIEVTITIIPANKLNDSKVSLFQKAFDGNPAVVDITTFDTPFGTNSFVVFAPKVVQYYNDDMYDLNGICSTLYQELAKSLFGEFANIHFCTEKM